MYVVPQKATVLFPETKEQAVQQLKLVEYAGRNCYRSHDRITDKSYVPFIQALIKNGHESPLEFAQFSVKLLTSRDVLAELTRHRLASFAVESQRYVDENGDGGIHFILPQAFKKDDKATSIWEASMKLAEDEYIQLLRLGWNKQDARKVLPNSTACNIVMTANLREWLHIFDLRRSSAAYPEMRVLMNLIYREFNNLYGDIMIGEEYD